MKRTAMVLLAALTLTACGPDPTMPMPTLQSNDRVSIERIGVIKDDTAYQARRGVYVIKDKKTGQEFIGISGVGISETGSHSSGKSSTTDER